MLILKTLSVLFYKGEGGPQSPAMQAVAGPMSQRFRLRKGEGQ